MFLAALPAQSPRPRPAPPPPPPPVAPKPYSLIWDSTKRRHDARPGETSAAFVFSVTNASAEEIEILRVQPACACTVAPMPRRPWVIGPGQSDTLTATMDFEGKHGVQSKTIVVESTQGSQVLTLTVNIPDEMDAAARVHNQEIALQERQAVFHQECAACHVAPLAGKKGAELFQAACGICHNAPARAAMVPDLAVARETRDRAYWEKWIADGKDGTLMPGFAARNGGPLSDEQIASLVAYAIENLPTKPAPAAAAPSPKS